MGFLLISQWAAEKIAGAPLVSLDDDSSFHFELRVELIIRTVPDERWLTCIVRDKSPYPRSDRCEEELISGGGGLCISMARSSGIVSSFSIPVTADCIDAVSEADFFFKEQNVTGTLPVFDCSPWYGQGEQPFATRAFRAPIHTTFLKAQQGLMLRWDGKTESEVSWYAIDEKVLIAVDSAHELAGFAVLDLPSAIMDKVLLINSGR